MDKYWEHRYKTGGSSGPGSVGRYRDWKWSTIELYLKPTDVIDVGCGDLSFWEGRDCERYLGIDTSPTVIAKDRLLRPNWDLRVGQTEDLIPNKKAEVVLCLDVLFHIMDDISYKKILENLCQYSKKWIFIYTWRKDPLAPNTSHYMIYRNLDTTIFNGFGLIKTHEINNKENGQMYVFRKKI